MFKFYPEDTVTVGRIKQRVGSKAKYTYPDGSIGYGKILERFRIKGTFNRQYRVFFDKVGWENGKTSYRLVYYYRKNVKSKKAWIFGQRPPDFPRRLWINLLNQIEDFLGRT